MIYNIEGAPMPVVICELEDRECMICEGGGMAWMSPNMLMETTSGGGLGKMFGRMMSGEKLFLNRYTASGKGMIAFASCFPGSVEAFDIMPGSGIIAQKSAFLAAEAGVELSTFFRRSVAGGLFGGEGFIMQKISGRGTAFLEFDGYVKTYDLQPGQQIIVDTGSLAAMSETCQMDIVSLPGIKNALFGGEGLFNTRITGPGKVWLQTMPISRMAEVLRPFMPTGGNN